MRTFRLLFPDTRSMYSAARLRTGTGHRAESHHLYIHRAGRCRLSAQLLHGHAEDLAKWQEKYASLNITFAGDLEKSVDTPMAETGNEAWYALSGKKLNGRPTKNGIYIRNGRKVLVNREVGNTSCKTRLGLQYRRFFLLI